MIFLFLIYICNYLFDERIYKTTNSNIDIFFCYFFKQNSFSGDGGTIYCSGSIINMNILDTTFYYCSSTGWAGAIYFMCNFLGTNSKLERVCAFKCYCNIGHQFGIILTYNNINSNNIINLISIIKCNNISIGSRSFTLQNGNMTLLNLNSSKNINTMYSGIDLSVPSYLNGKFLTFYDNECENYGIFRLYDGKNNLIQFSNIIKNKCQNSIFYIEYNGIYNFSNSIIIENLNGYLFIINTGSYLNLLNSIIHHNYNLYSNSLYYINNNLNLITNTFNLNHLNTFLCNNNNKITFLNNIKIKYFINYLILNFLFSPK